MNLMTAIKPTLINKKHGPAVLCILTLIVSMFLNGCASRGKSYEKPIEGVYRTSISHSSKQKDGYKLVHRELTDQNAYFGFVQDYRKKVLRSNKVNKYYLSGNRKSDCAIISGGTLFIYTAIDFAIWAIQLGTNSTICFSQIIDFSPQSSWSKNLETGEFYKYSEPYTGSMTFSYNGATIPAKREGNGLWSIRRIDLPTDADIFDVKLRNSTVYFK